MLLGGLPVWQTSEEHPERLGAQESAVSNGKAALEGGRNGSRRLHFGPGIGGFKWQSGPGGGSQRGAFCSLVGPLRGAEPGERAWTPDPYSRPNEGGGDPCQSDLGPQGIPGELTTGLNEGGGDPCQSDLAPRTLPGIARSGAGMGHPASL